MNDARVTQPTAITIGNFDGVHRGHAALVQAARRAIADHAPDGRVVVLSFDPHPATILRPEMAPPGRLSSVDQRSRWLGTCGADELVRLEPTREFLEQSPQEFIRWVHKQWSPKVIVEGSDFRFGKSRAGSIETLKSLEQELEFRTLVVDPVEVALTDQTVVRASSSMARWLVERGRMRDVEIVLGRPYELEALVIQGDRRGRTLGYPTANLEPVGHLLPADGIYAGLAWRDHKGPWPAAISVGTKPTFGQSPRTCEAHLLDFEGPEDEYGWGIRLHISRWIRDQMRYDRVEHLLNQMKLDIAAVRTLATVAFSRSQSLEREPQHA